MNVRRLEYALVVVAVFWALPIIAHAQSFAYVSLSGEEKIAIYAVDSSTGKWTPRSQNRHGGLPGSLASNPSGELLFAAIRGTGQLAAFRRDSRTGSLRHLNTVQAGDDPAFITVDQTGRYLLTAYYVAAKVTVHRIADDGRLGTQPWQTIKTDDKAHAILLDRTNKLAFVPHTGPNAIFQFAFDSGSGKLKANSQAKIKTGVGTGPRQLAYHPKLDIVFFDYEQGSAIASFDLDRSSGRLKFRQRLSSVPDSYNKGNSNARIEITPSGRFVYVANRGHNSLAGFGVDPRSGKLTALGQTPTEPVPRGFTIHPSGKFLYAAGEASGRVAAYRIHQKTGALDRIATYEVGKRPWWIHVVGK